MLKISGGSDDLVEAKVIRYKSFDSLDIPSIMYKPMHIKQGEKAPALVWVHGGPGGQSRTGYHYLIQYFTGYIVNIHLQCFCGN